MIEIENIETMICKFEICNKSKENINNLVLDINIPNDSSFVSGYIKRERGILEITEGLEDLVLGNIKYNEQVNVLIKLMKTKKEIPLKVSP